MAECKVHWCSKTAAADCDYSFCGACCGGCSRHETRYGYVDIDKLKECDVCNYDFEEWGITLAEHQEPGTLHCYHAKQCKKEEENGYIYAYCLCCDKCLGLSTW